MGMEMPRLARRAARESGLKLMVHIGDTEKRYDPTVIRALLPLLDAGDILTHLFTANPGGVLDGNGKLVPEAREAADRGVWFDTAHGRMNFSFEVGRRVIDQGLLLGSLAAGRQADVSVLELREGDWVVRDALGATLRVSRCVVPFLTVKRGRVFMPDWGPRPWGWEPDRALT
jgi:predicted amidohydrolase